MCQPRNNSLLTHFQPLFSSNLMFQGRLHHSTHTNPILRLPCFEPPIPVVQQSPPLPSTAYSSRSAAQAMASSSSTQISCLDWLCEAKSRSPGGLYNGPFLELCQLATPFLSTPLGTSLTVPVCQTSFSQSEDSRLFPAASLAQREGQMRECYH